MSMEINRNNLGHKNVVWACAYDEDNNYDYSHLKQLPIQGMILDKHKVGMTKPKYSSWIFVPLNKNGEPIKSKVVDIYSRHYANTYEECVEVYNGLVQARIDRLNEIINECETHKITI